MNTSLDKVRPTQRKADISAALLWAVLGSLQVSFFLARPSVLQAGFVVFAVTIPLLFIIRRPAPASGPRYLFWLAMVGTFLPMGTLRPVGSGWPLIGEFVQATGLVVTVLALWTLNRSFGLAPANRGLVTRGVYGLVRHPLYAGEILTLAGYCLGYGSLLNWFILAATVAVQVARAFAEEKLLLEDRGYEGYRQRVRWRLVPRIW
jgi:protein-S-isoprenylcysteine O-methyltransferase Ste14